MNEYGDTLVDVVEKQDELSDKIKRTLYKTLIYLMIEKKK